MSDGSNWTAFAASNSYSRQQSFAESLARTQALAAYQQSQARQNALALQAQQASYNACLAGIAGMVTFGLTSADYNFPLNHIGPRERPRVESDGLQVGEIHGWRVWYVKKDVELLTSVTMDNVWLPCEIMDGSPSDYGFDGVHAYKEIHRALNGYARNGTTWAPRVVGKIALWGEVVEHTDGYRAQYGRPIHLETIVPSTFITRRLLKRLKAKYEVEWVPDEQS